MRATRLLSFAAAVGFLLCASRSQAATPLHLDLGVFGGWHYFSSTNQLGIDVGNTNPDLALSQSGTFGLRVGFIVHPYVSLEAELGLTPTGASTAAGEAKALAINYRAHLLVHVLKGKIRPFILAGGGGNTLSSSNPDILKEDTDGEFHFGIGSKFDIQKNWGIRLDGRLYVVPTTNADKIYATNDFEVLVGFYGLFGGPKELPRAIAPPPPANPDRDGDGILNADDLCPDLKGVAENRGCPDKDSDGDMIVDRLDKCPQDKGSEENGGCPDKDSDGDSIVDRLDKCPQDKGPPENGGCPDTDTDKDGVPDRLDKCPNEAETMNGYQDLDGCPDELPKEIKKYTGAVKGINFANGKAELLPSSNKVLDEIVTVLKNYPDVKIEIQGHTDNNGERNKNIDLSQARAASVRTYLVTHGIDEKRITSVGFGPDKPVADNKNAAGKAKNRRVEFKLIN
jgi:outer membrane protein OmpA-like peptidoglycan-associated protein